MDDANGDISLNVKMRYTMTVLNDEMVQIPEVSEWDFLAWIANLSVMLNKK
jgi:hypothetical protein